MANIDLKPISIDSKSNTGKKDKIEFLKEKLKEILNNETGVNKDANYSQ